MKRVAVFAPLIALVLFFGVAIYVMTGEERAAHFEAQTGRAAPVYSLNGFNGNPVTPASFEGRAYIINLFASWCAPCRVEHPVLMLAKAEGAPILGVAYKDTPEAAAQFLSQLGDPFEMRALDPEGRFGLDIGVTGVPETYVVGADGRIRAVHRGPLTEDALRNDILPALRD
ncbi:MAG: DsbE family thiol:disulfide interchange protein [Caulobacterales bacterium]